MEVNQEKKRVVLSSPAAAALGLAGAAFVATGAHAEVPADVKTEMDGGKADAKEIGYMALVVVIAIAALKYMRRAV